MNITKRCNSAGAYHPHHEDATNSNKTALARNRSSAFHRRHNHDGSNETHFSKSEGLTPNHLISGVARDAASCDMLSEPCMYTERIFRPWASLSNRPRTGIFNVSRTRLTNIPDETGDGVIHVLASGGMADE